MKQTELVNDLFAALAKAQGAFKPIYKNKTMKIPGRDDYQYADLAEIIKTVQPDLAAHGLSIIQLLDMDEKGPLLITRLAHLSGQWVEATLPLGTYARHQEFGVEISYKRRYALCSILGIMAEDDIDGQGEQPKPQVSAPINQTKPAAVKLEDPAKRLITQEDWLNLGLKIKGALNIDKKGVEDFVLKITGKTSPRTLTHGDLLALENEIGLKQLDKGLPL